MEFTDFFIVASIYMRKSVTAAQLQKKEKEIESEIRYEFKIRFEMVFNSLKNRNSEGR